MSDCVWANEKMELLARIADMKVAHASEVASLRASLVEKALEKAEAVSAARFAQVRWNIGTLIAVIAIVATLYGVQHK